MESNVKVFKIDGSDRNTNTEYSVEKNIYTGCKNYTDMLLFCRGNFPYKGNNHWIVNMYREELEKTSFGWIYRAKWEFFDKK